MSHVYIGFSKRICLLGCFAKVVMVVFVLLWVIRLIKLLCVNWVMTTLSLPLLTWQIDSFWVSLAKQWSIFLAKEMRGKDAPLGVPKIYMLKFWESYKNKQNYRKNMHIKMLYIEILMRYNLGNNILYKRIVSSNLVTLITIRKTTMRMFFFGFED